MFQTAIDVATNDAFAFAGRSVVFRRLSPAGTISIKAIVGKLTHELDTEYGVLTKDTRDYICRTADVGTVAIGDRFEETIGEDLHVYEVYSPSGQDHFYHPDPEKKRIRIHTQLIDIQ